ncbi:MAG: YraN family protein [Lachnospiraceae bacterium]|nr:YraN family protein [Lachnospiraceae bacterium]MCI9284045.1 YraN family protein [Lachnospiraceae bacterium]
MNANDKIHENKRDIGKRYEELAADYLCKKGVEILERNYRNHTGEIDLIGRDGECLVFIEVKYRRNRKNGEPAEAVTAKKQQHIRRTAQYYLYSHRCGDVPCRFDVISILGNRIDWITNAF